MKQKIKVGDVVMYSREFLKSSGQITGNVGFDVGIVKGIKSYGGSFVLAVIKWKLGACPTRVNVFNLVLKNRIHLESV